jgi:thiamine-monophosphate kinase
MGLGEFDRIEKFFKPLAAHSPGALGLSDDAAVLPVAGLAGLVISTDALVEGVHFRIDDPAELIARKALRTNLSDLAAMGAEPWVYTLSLALGPMDGALVDPWVARLAAGLGIDQEKFSIGLIGGDSVSTPGPVMVSITIFGKQGAHGVLIRSGAAAGDDIYVSGTIGDAALGLKVLSGELTGLDLESSSMLVDRYHLPRPRVDLGMALVGCASAAMDVSDGLAQDLAHLCKASGVAGEISFKDVPLSRAAGALLADGLVGVEDICGGGDDYELLFTAPRSARDAVERRAELAGTPVCRIGEIDVGQGVSFRDGGGRLMPLRQLGYRHA